MDRKLVTLDWIRGIAAIFIVLYHFTTGYEQIVGHIPIWPVNFPHGALAVIAFFLLSGFLTVYQLDDTMTAKSYGIKRVFRLYPAYWCCILLTTAVTAVFMPSLTKDLKTICLNLTMLQSFLRVDSVDGVYWTLAYEVRFYVYIFLVLLFRQHKHIEKYLLAWIGASILVYLLPDDGLFHLYRGGMELVFMSNRAAQFAGGSFLALIIKYKKYKAGFIGIILCTALQLLTGTPDEHLVFCLCLLLISLSTIWDKQIQESLRRCPKFLKKLSDFFTFVASISYPLYLLHQYIGRSITYRLQGVGLGQEGFIVVPVATVICLAWLVHRYVEIPCSRLSKQILCHSER